MEYILAHDFGTSADKASLFTTGGQFVKTKTVSYPTHYSFGTHAEQDPEDWWNAFCASTKALLEGIDASKVLCVAFDGTYPNCLCIDRDLKPLHRAMIWQDSRSYVEAREISALLPPKYTAGRPNNILPTDRTLGKLLWVKKHLPEVFEKTYKVFPSVMDFIILKMTGNTVCDMATGGGTAMMNVERTDWSDEVLGIAGIPRSMMPTLKKRTDVVGEVPAAMTALCGLAAGTKLVMGTGDSACTTIGAGMLNEGDAYMNGGTSAGILAKGRDGKQLGGQTTSSGSSLSWLKNNICIPEQQLAKQMGRDVYDIIGETIASVSVGSNGVLFHPYLAGERAPRNNPRAKGSFVGITLTTTREDLMRSVVEGIGLNVNLILQSIRDQGYDLRRIPIVGGMGKGPVVRQIFSDIMNIELVTFEYMDEAATVGAAVLGGIAIGLYKDESAVEKFMKISSVTVPNAENHEKYRKIMPLFEEVYEAQKPVYEHM
jgi:xylulokinase